MFLTLPSLGTTGLLNTLNAISEYSGWGFSFTSAGPLWDLWTTSPFVFRWKLLCSKRSCLLTSGTFPSYVSIRFLEERGKEANLGYGEQEKSGQNVFENRRSFLKFTHGAVKTLARWRVLRWSSSPRKRLASFLIPDCSLCFYWQCSSRRWVCSVIDRLPRNCFRSDDDLF